MHKVVTLQGSNKGEERSMKFGLISIEKNKNAYISEQPASEIPDVETNIEPQPIVMSPPSRDDGTFRIRPSKTTRWVACFAFLVLGTVLMPDAYAMPSILNSIVSAPNNSPSSVDLAWDASPDTNVTGYAVYSGPASRDYTSRVDVGANLTFTVNGLNPNQTYYFTANAYDAAGNESDFSNEIVVSTADTNAPPTASTNIVIVTVPVLSSTNPSGPWQLEAMCTLSYTNPTGNKFFMPGRLSISNSVQ